MTLMEALGSGLPLIGFDVRYGNQTFIREGENGYLLPLPNQRIEEEIATAYAEKICLIYKEQNLERLRQGAYERGAAFLTARVEEAWDHLIQEVLA